MSMIGNLSRGVAGVPFITTWKTDNAGTSSSTQITLPLVSSGTYNMMVEWGDGTASNIKVYNDAAVTHTYSSAGTYNVRIFGTCTGWQFNNGGDKLKLLNISKWGPFKLGNTALYFHGCANLTITATDILDLTGTTDFTNAFRACASIVTIPSINSWITSAITNMSSAFQDNVALNQAFSFDTRSVTNLSAFLRGCTVYNQLLSLNTSACTNMALMVFNCPAFDQDVSQFSIAALTNAISMFASSGFSITNYNKLLDSVTGWPSQPTIQSGVTFSAGSAHYSGANAIAGRAVFTGTYSWTITDGGTP